MCILYSDSSTSRTSTEAGEIDFKRLLSKPVWQDKIYRYTVLYDENRTLSLNAGEDTLYSDSKYFFQNIFYCRNGFTMNQHVCDESPQCIPIWYFGIIILVPTVFNILCIPLLENGV